MVKKRRRPKKKHAKKEPATVHHKHKTHRAHQVHQVHHTPKVHHTNPVNHTNAVHHEHHSSQEHVGNSTERVLVQNFVSLQKVMVNLSEKLIVLNNQVSKLLDLFEVSARTLAKKDFDLGKKEKEDTKKIIDKLENLSGQNKIIAKGLTLIHENNQGGQKIEEPMTFEQEEPQEEQEPMMEDLPAPPKPWQMPPTPFMQKNPEQMQMPFKLPPLEKMPTFISTAPMKPINQNNPPRRNMNQNQLGSAGLFKIRRQEIEPIEPIEPSEQIESATPEPEQSELVLPEIGSIENESDDFEESMSSDSSPFEGK